MWCYQKINEMAWGIGFYSPKGKWVQIRTASQESEAAEIIHYLNGGSLLKSPMALNNYQPNNFAPR